MSNSLPQKLKLKQHCPLLGDEHSPLVDSFNSIIDSLVNAGDIFGWIQAYLDPGDSPASSNRHVRRGLRERLDAIRTQLVSEKYRVGVAGRFQVGKTSSINTVLKHKLLSEGKTGASCTSVVTIVDLSPVPRKPAYEVLYFTSDEIKRRFEEVASQEEFNGCPVRQLPTPENAPDAVTQLEKWAGNVVEELKGDAEFLVAVLADYASGQHLIGETLPPIECDSEKHLEESLAQLVTYGAEDDVADVTVAVTNPLLIKHVRVLIHLPGLAPTLELVDLPGLGTVRTYDTTLTTGYIQDLQGLLLFLQPRQLNANELGDIVQSFRHSHQELSGRLWAVIGQMDMADVEQLQGPLFNTFLKFLPTISIEPHQVRFLSNYCEIRENGKPEKYPTKSLEGQPEKLAAGLKLSLENGQVQLPNSLQEEPAHHVFVSSFNSYMKDGGITAFEEVIRTNIADSVRDATCREVKKLALSLVYDLRNCLNDAKEGGLDGRNCDLASGWSFVFLEIADHLAPGKLRDELNTIASPMFEKMWGHLLPDIHNKSVDRVREAERKPEEEDQWVGLHKMVTEGMSRDLRADIPSIVQVYADKIEELLTETAERRSKLKCKNGKLEFPRGFNPLERFRTQIREEVIEQEFFEPDLAVLEEPIPIVNPLDPNRRSEITTSEYLVVMRRKVETLCYRILSKMRILVARECQLIQRQLAIRSRVRQGPDVLDAEKLTAALEHLEASKKYLEKFQSGDFVGVAE